jgi:hypothetical protein
LIVHSVVVDSLTVTVPVGIVPGMLRITEIPHSRSPKFPRGRAAWRA